MTMPTEFKRASELERELGISVRKIAKLIRLGQIEGMIAGQYATSGQTKSGKPRMNTDYAIPYSQLPKLYEIRKEETKAKLRLQAARAKAPKKNR